MENIKNNKLDLFQKLNLTTDVKKAKDVLGTDEIKVKDLFGKKSTINNLSDLFPHEKSSEDNGFLA